MGRLDSELLRFKLRGSLIRHLPLRDILRLGRIWIASKPDIWGASDWFGEGRLTSRAHLVGRVLRLGRIWLAGGGRLTSGAHLLGW